MDTAAHLATTDGGRKNHAVDASSGSKPNKRCCRSWKQNGAGKCTVCGHRGSNPQQVLATLARGGCVTRRTADSRSCKPATWQDRECVTSANSLQMPRNLKEGSHPLDDPICATRRPHRR
ncbi:uncharacterized protein LOC144133867 isoform X2 [Amblyomma americanum]